LKRSWFPEEENPKGMFTRDDYKFRAWVEFCPICGTKAQMTSVYLEQTEVCV